MYACLLKRVVPFVLALKLGLLLVLLVSQLSRPLRKAGDSFVPVSTHSRTWLFVSKLPAPDYTEQEASVKGATGTLRLHALLDMDGTVSAVELGSEGTEEFFRDAAKAARSIKFRPATEDGVPISLWATIDYSCSGYYFAHKYRFMCTARIAEVEREWRVIHE